GDPVRVPLRDRPVQQHLRGLLGRYRPTRQLIKLSGRVVHPGRTARNQPQSEARTMSRSKGRSRNRSRYTGPAVEGEVQQPLRMIRDVGGSFNMGDLSKDAEVRPPLQATFTYFGKTIRVHPDLT